MASESLRAAQTDHSLSTETVCVIYCMAINMLHELRAGGKKNLKVRPRPPHLDNVNMVKKLCFTIENAIQSLTFRSFLVISVMKAGSKDTYFCVRFETF